MKTGTVSRRETATETNVSRSFDAAGHRASVGVAAAAMSPRSLVDAARPVSVHAATAELSARSHRDAPADRASPGVAAVTTSERVGFDAAERRTSSGSALGLALLFLVGCAPALPDASAAETFELQAIARFDVNGETAQVELPAASEGVALRVTASRGTCFQLSGLTAESGEALAHGFFGPSCEDCAVRTSVARDAALFVLPAARVVRFGQVDCETLTPVAQGTGAVVVEALPLEPHSGERVLPVRLVVTDGSSQLDDAARAALSSAVDDALAGSGVSVRIVSVTTVPPPSSHVRFHAGDASALAALRATAGPAVHAVDVVVAGCLQYADPFFGPPEAVDGYTPRVPGGAGPADAVFLPDVDCTSGLPLSVPLSARGRTLAHELGHWLGLFHVDAANLMNAHPTLASSRGLTPEQRETLRRHPSLEPRASR